MAKPTINPNPKTKQVFVDLEEYLDFCKNFGYRYNEADLYNNRSYPYQQFSKFKLGKNCKDMWAEDAKRFSV